MAHPGDAGGHVDYLVINRYDIYRKYDGCCAKREVFAALMEVCELSRPAPIALKETNAWVFHTATSAII